MDRLLTAMSAHYDEVYDMAQAILDRHNPCGITINSGGKASCVKYDIDYCNGQICCSRCDHHFRHGCSIKALGCKVSLCDALPNNSPAELEMAELHGNTAFFGILSHIRIPKETIMKWLTARERCRFNNQYFCLHSIIPGLTPESFTPLFKMCNPSAKYACSFQGDKFVEQCMRNQDRQMHKLFSTPKAKALYSGESPGKEEHESVLQKV